MLLFGGPQLSFFFPMLHCVGLLLHPSPPATFPEHKNGIFVLFGASKPSFSGISSTKSRFLCFFGVWNPCFQAFRAQNRGFCALLGFGTLVFGHFEHKIEVFVLFWPSGPPFSGISSTKSRFLCFFGLQDPRFRAFRAQNRGFCAREADVRHREVCNFEFLRAQSQIIGIGSLQF